MKLTRRLVLSLVVVPGMAEARTPRGKPKVVPTGSPGETPLGPVDTVAKWAFIQDYNTGAVLLDKNSNEQMPPSSMTKLMTMYLVYERLKQGQLKLTDSVPVSARAAAMGGSKMFLTAASAVSIEDLVRGVIVQSGNDAATVLAETIGGTEDRFIEIMNAKAKTLGLTRSLFRNATGWPDPEQVMTARDIATLARRIITDFPEYYKYDSEKSFRYGGITQENRHPMVQAGTADGLKTGHTDAGGYGLAASSIRDGRRLIMVLNGMKTMHDRALESERMMSWAFSGFENVRLFSANEVIDNAPVWLGRDKTVPLVGGQDLVVTMPRSWRQTASVQISYDAPIRAPIAKGDPVATLLLRGQGVPSMDVKLVAGVDVGRLSLPFRGLAVISHFISGG